MLGERAHTALPAAYTATPPNKTGLRPRRSLIGPHTSSPTTKNRKKPTIVRFTKPTVVSKYAGIWGTDGV